MKSSFTMLASLCTAAIFGATAQAAPTFESVLALVAQLQDDVMTLSTECAAKDDEMVGLNSLLSECGEGTPPAVPADEPVEPEAPTPEPPAPAPSVDGEGFTFSIGQSWNYNLDMPWNIDDVEVDVYFIDMNIGQTAIDELHARNKGVVCYISIGSWEDWREDKDDFPSDVFGNRVSGWGDEKWLDITNPQLRDIMSARVQKAAGMKCDGVEPDHMMTTYETGTGLDVSVEQQIEYNTWFAGEVRAAGMKVGLKNAVEMVKEVAGSFDFAINESCHIYNMCTDYADTFLSEGKPVYNIEYEFDTDICDGANELGIDTILKNYDAQAPFCSCRYPSLDYQCMH